MAGLAQVEQVVGLVQVVHQELVAQAAGQVQVAIVAQVVHQEQAAGQEHQEPLVILVSLAKAHQDTQASAVSQEHRVSLATLEYPVGLAQAVHQEQVA